MAYNIYDQNGKIRSYKSSLDLTPIPTPTISPPPAPKAPTLPVSAYGSTDAKQLQRDELLRGVANYKSPIALPQQTTAEQDIAEEKKLMDLMQPQKQGMIDAINQAYIVPIQEAQQKAKAQVARSMALANAAGLAGSPSGLAQVQEQEKASQQNVDNVLAEKNLKIQSIYGDLQKEAQTRLAAKKAEDFGNSEKALQLRQTLLENANKRLASLSSAGISFEDLKKSNPDYVNSLREDLGMSDLEIDAYLTGKNKSVKDWKTQTIGNKTYIIKMYDDGTIETSEFATDMQPNEELKIVDGVPYAQFTNDKGNIELRLVQGYTESPEKATERRLKESQMLKNYADIKQGSQTTSGATSEAADTMNLTEAILNDKNFDLAFGGQRVNPITYLPGSNAYGIRTQVDQLIAKLSLANRGKLKGSGAISDFESKTLEKASSGLNVNMSPQAARTALRQVKGVLSTMSGNSATVKMIDPKTGEYQLIEADRNGIEKAINDGIIVEYQ